jgi:hypothetical protein
MPTIKFHNSDIIIIRLKDNPQPEILIGPIINRTLCIKSYYLIEVSNSDGLLDRYTDNMTTYREFKKHYKITSAHKLDLDEPLTNEELLDDLDFIKNEIVNCRITLNLHLQKGDMKKFTFYNNLLNSQQHSIFHLPSADHYMEYLNKIAKLIDKDPMDVIDNNKKLMDQVINMSEVVWKS